MRIFYCTWAILALLAQSAAAQADTGYTIFVRGVPIGREMISVRTGADGTTVTSQGSATAPISAVFRRVEYRYGADGNPRSFEFEGLIGSTDVSLRTTFVNGSATTVGLEGKTPVNGTQPFSPGSVVLPTGMFSGFAELARRLASVKAGDEIPTFIAPRAETRGRVVSVTSERMQRATELVDVRRYELSFPDGTAATTVNVSTSAAGDLVRVNIPSQWLEFVRDDFAGATSRTDIHSNPGDVAVLIPAPGFNLGATVTIPAKSSDATAAKRPAVVIVGGPEAQDRDAIIDGVPAFGQLAGTLSDAGFIVVRYDRRGSGQSGGRAESATLSDYADDVRTVVKWTADRKDVDDKRIAVVGYDTGAWLAMLAASRDNRISALVSLATASSPGAELALEQQQLQFERMKTPAGERDTRIALQKQLNAAVLSGKGWEGIAPELRKQADTPWFQSFLAFDPAKIADNIDAHWLLVHGDLDKEIGVTHAQKLSDVARKGDAESVDLVVVKGVNHLLQTAVTGDVTEYQALAAKGVSPDVSSAVVGWLQRTLPASRRN
jgi:pimeloyl-ACP methyl ester carboxylesterase